VDKSKRRLKNKQRSTSELTSLYHQRKGKLPTSEIEHELAERGVDLKQGDDDEQKRHGDLSEHHWR